MSIHRHRYVAEGSSPTPEGTPDGSRSERAGKAQGQGEGQRQTRRLKGQRERSEKSDLGAHTYQKISATRNHPTREQIAEEGC